MNQRKNHLYLLIALFLLVTGTAKAQVRIDHQEPEAVENALFGWASYIYGHQAVITAPQRDVDGILSKGTAFFYRKTNSGWVIEQEITPPGLPAFANFGISVAMSAEEAFIASLADEQGHLFSGSVYVYQHNDTSWVNTDILHPSDQMLGNRFGYSMDIQYLGDELIVGAYHARGSADKSGAAYIFRKENGEWLQSQKIYPLSGESHDYFGHQVRFVGEDMVAVGAYNTTGAADRSGAVYIFEKDAEGTWQETAKLYDPDGNTADLFGYSIAPEIEASELSDTGNFEFSKRIIIGAPGARADARVQSGAVYFYTNDINGWTLTHKLVEENTAHNDHFGVSVAHNSDIGLFISANHAGLTNTGKMFKYEYHGSDRDITILDPVLFIGNDDAVSAEYYGSKLMVNHEFDFIIASPHKTMGELENAGDVEFYSMVSTSTEDEPFITDYKLEQNYPNPFNPTTQIRYQVRESGRVELTVFNLLGQTVQTLVSERQNAGAYTATFDASALSSGFYFYRLEVNDFVSTKKMMLIK